ncbi:MAG: hypothetical protein ACRBBN_11035 [Methyloligellaceae bacterium]
MNWAIEFFPLLPLNIVWTLCIITALFSLALLFIKKQYAILRILCFLLLLGVIANPQLKHEKRNPLNNIAIAVIDESDSQSVAKRREITKEIKKKLAATLATVNRLEVRWVTIRNTADSGRREGRGTRLFAGLRKSLSTVPAKLLAGVFLITDGQAHDVPDSLENLGLKAPVHTIITGNKREFDQRIKIIKSPKFGLVGSEAFIELEIVQNGAADKKQNSNIRIRREGQDPEVRTVIPGKKFEVAMTFPHAGSNIIEIELEAIPGELTLANNRVAIVSQGVRENLRVLLVSGEPHAGERTWRNLLKSDASVDLVHFTILRPPEKQDGTPINQLSLIAFPTRQLFSEKLNQFDLIIFDRYRRRGVLPLLYLDNIARYVENGGAILVAAGSTFSSTLSLYETPLSHILPAEPTGTVIEKPYLATVTDAGKKHPVTRNLPGDAPGQPKWGKWFRLIQVKPKVGNILMKGHDNNPLLILNRLGKGRVALLVSDHAWLWARGYDGGGPYVPLLRRLAHWLMKEPDLEEEFLSATKKGSKIVIERRTMQNRVSDAEVQLPDGKKKKVKLREVQPGLWRGQIDSTSPGLYKFSSDNLSSLVHSGLVESLEMSDVSATSRLLQPVANQTGGGIFWLPQTNEVSIPRIAMLSNSRTMFGRDWLALRDRNAYQISGVVYVPLIPAILLLLILAGIFSFTWFREGR